MRMCVACGTFGNGKEMFRIVKNADGTVAYDPTGRMAGRGAYVCRNAECIKTAFRKKGFDRSLHAKLSKEAEESIQAALFEEMNIIEE